MASSGGICPLANQVLTTPAMVTNPAHRSVELVVLIRLFRSYGDPGMAEGGRARCGAAGTLHDADATGLAVGKVISK
jgi:hypothetical protein